MKRTLNITRLEEKALAIREMTTLEIYGAVAILTELLNEWYDEMGCEKPENLYARVDHDTYYCGKHLYIEGGYILNDDEGSILLTSVFCVNNNTTDLFGYAEYEDEDGNVTDVLVRI